MKHTTILLLLLGLVVLTATGQNANHGMTLKPGELEIKPGYETCSYYFCPADARLKAYTVEFRRSGENAWKRAFSPVSDIPAGIWKGSIFGLRENSDWELRVLSGNETNILFQREFRTCNSNPPIARIVDLSKTAVGKSSIEISDRGSPDGWIKYTASRPLVLNPCNSNESNLAAITFKNARYIILENITLVSGYRCGIDINDSDDIRVINCDISGWGIAGIQDFDSTGKTGTYLDTRGRLINYDAGIRIYHSARSVIERCYIHDPKGRANSWMFSHPAGPSAVYVYESRGGTVLRWNDMIGSDEHRWNDVVESSANGSPDGGFYRDADIYGNFLAFGNDDGIELEGGGMNVRFYHNKIEGTLCGVSTGACLLGPQYVFGNLLVNPGDESGLSLMFFKNSHGVFQSGKRFFVNNTLYGLNNTAYGSYGKSPDARIGFMRNNILVCGTEHNANKSTGFDDFDCDLFWDGKSQESSLLALTKLQKLGLEKHVICADPQLVNPAMGNFQLQASSPARNKSAEVDNLTAPGSDLGAFINGIDDLPQRPLPFIAAPSQLNFNSSGEKSAMEVLLRCSDTALQPVQFNIRQNKAFDWFKVEPSAGEIKPGQTIKLIVSLQPGKINGRPLFRGAFLVRTTEGLSRPVTVYAKCDFTENLHPPEAPGTVYLEAANIPGSEQFVKTCDAANIHGGKYVIMDGAKQQPVLEFKFNLPQSGKYYLLARIAKDNSSMGNFDFTLDNVATLKIITNPWYNWHMNDNRFRVIWLTPLGKLSAGEHRLIVKPVKSRSCLNELIITANPEVFFIQHCQKQRQ